MILVDSSVWIDHLRSGDRRLRELLESGLVLCHPWVVGELALGQLKQRREILHLLGQLPAAEPVAEPAEVLGFVEQHRLMSRGIGYVDVQLLAAARLVAARLWSRDERLVTAAVSLGCTFPDDAVDA